MNLNKIRTFALAVLVCCPILHAQNLSTSFEMRGFTRNPKADGITDFHGETEVYSTPERVAALGDYARFAARFWGNPGLDTPLFTDAEISAGRARIKEQPLTTVRRTVPLREWRSYGYKKGKAEATKAAWAGWTRNGARIEGGCLILEGTEASCMAAGAVQSTAGTTLDWRFRLRASVQGPAEDLAVICSGKEGRSVRIPVGILPEFELYGDLQNRRLFLSSGGRTVREIALDPSFGNSVTDLSFSARKAAVGQVRLYAFVRQEDNVEMPYRVELVCQDSFDAPVSMTGWQEPAYNDAAWEPVTLPAAHGALAEAGESFYLRTKVQVGDFGYAALDIETLDPAGEIWVNGTPAAVLKGRIPRRIDISEYLVPNSENTIAVRVKPYVNRNPMHHAPSDLNIGWFLGRTDLILTDADVLIEENLMHTTALKGKGAVQHHKVSVRNHTHFYRKGELVVNYYPWFPQEGGCTASKRIAVELRPNMTNVFDFDLEMDQAQVWSTSAPNLYRVETIWEDAEKGKSDDCVTTTGIRTIIQKEGVLYVNGKPEILRGAQIFGYRLPLETMVKTQRCATDDMVMRDLRMIRDMGGNLLRIHVHSTQDVSDGINDPRYAEYADQMGLYLIWQSAAWLREGEAWNVDIEDYPLYMKQVYNHPSIVLWEASNHPNRFKQHGPEETVDYFSKITRTILATDTSRLVSPTSFWPHSYYANYDCSLDYKGNPIKADPILMHPMMTRGSQDAYTGYGTDWSALRKMDNAWAKSCLEAKGLGYYNFEHEESAAQPNWTLSRKDPWHELQSYEWKYEEGSIGRKLEAAEWRESQAFQAFSAWESMKMQTLAGVSGFSWCSIESGPNMFTYQKPLIDPYYVPKLAFYANKMVFQDIWAGSGDVDVTYGPSDKVAPVIFNLAEACTADLSVELQDANGRVLERKVFRGIEVPAGRSVTRLEPFRFRSRREGNFFLVYKLSRK